MTGNQHLDDDLSQVREFLEYMREAASLYDETEPPAVLYHYTAQDGLLGIARTRQLWATDVRYVNDETELSHALDLAEDFLDDYLDENAPVRRELESRREPLAQFVAATFDRMNVFAFSLSEARDQLSQWKAYAGGIGGCSLGFRANHLKEALDGQHCILVPCVYDDDEKMRILGPRIEKAVESPTPAVLRYLTLALTMCAPRFKDGAFSEEREWRLIRIKAQPNEIKHRPGVGSLVPYLTLSFEDEQAEILEEIVLGPCADFELAESAVGSLMAANGFASCRLRGSAVPLRF